MEPEIPNNTGNVGRTCVGNWCQLHLVGPLGFEINDKQLKRAGLDYWPHLQWTYYDTFDQWYQKVPDKGRVFFFSTKAKETYYSHNFREGDWLVFGKETAGLGQHILEKYPQQLLAIPMVGTIRSLNLATAVAVVVYEGLRQIHYSAT